MKNNVPHSSVIFIIPNYNNWLLKYKTSHTFLVSIYCLLNYSFLLLFFLIFLVVKGKTKTSSDSVTSESDSNNMDKFSTNCSIVCAFTIYKWALSLASVGCKCFKIKPPVVRIFSTHFLFLSIFH